MTAAPDNTTAPPKVRPIYRIELRAEPGVDPVRALRGALKTLLRKYGLICTDVREVRR